MEDRITVSTKVIFKDNKNAFVGYKWVSAGFNLKT